MHDADRGDETTHKQHRLGLMSTVLCRYDNFGSQTGSLPSSSED